MNTAAAIGVREHSGWAALVAVAGDRAAPAVIDRRRITLLPPGMPGEAYHAVVGMPVERARERVREVFDGARECATREIATARAALEAQGYMVSALGCGVSLSPVQVPLERVLKAHPLLHASEGALFRDAVAEAAEGLGLVVSRLPWRELWAQTGAELGGFDARQAVAKMGAGIGPPWASDQKEACAAAWLALAVVAEA